jgi:hypothetical protein
MSKSKKKKRKSPIPKKKKKSLKPVIITVAAVVLIAAAVLVSYLVYVNTSLSALDFTEKTLTSVKAYDASGDEAPLNNVYKVRYDDYKGTLKLNGDGTFDLWLQPGSKDDGIHGGKYTYNKEKDIINAKFDNGEKVKFKVIRKKDGSFKRIEVPYQGYTVYMK